MREPGEVQDYSADADLWLDYVADLGDGWNSTYTVARLLAAEELELEWDGETHATERGRILVMGGDQVYPVPKAVEYENRMLGPYRAALPCVPGEAPELFAIPGTHDWYDGLVNFTSVFCLNRWIGGWKTRQRRSYFALKLPNAWWLWGIDIQFGAYIDEVQLQYFVGVAAERVAPGDRIILCMGKEVESGRKHVELHSDRDVDYLERQVINANGAELLLYIKSGSTTTAAIRKKTVPGSTSRRAAAAPSRTPPTTSRSACTFPDQRDPSLTAEPPHLIEQPVKIGRTDPSAARSRRSTPSS